MLFIVIGGINVLQTPIAKWHEYGSTWFSYKVDQDLILKYRYSIWDILFLAKFDSNISYQLLPLLLMLEH